MSIFLMFSPVFFITVQSIAQTHGVAGSVRMKPLGSKKQVAVTFRSPEFGETDVKIQILYDDTGRRISI